jgi:hypothetical protein
VPIVRETICDNLKDHFKSENDNENVICVQENFCKIWSFLIVIDTQEHGVDHNSSHDKIFECLRLNNFEALKSQTVNWLNWNNLWVGVHQQSLDLDPFFLFFSKVMSSLSLLDFFIELINNNGNKQVHDKECGQENEDDVD